MSTAHKHSKGMRGSRDEMTARALSTVGFSDHRYGDLNAAPALLWDQWKTEDVVRLEMSDMLVVSLH